MENEDAVYKCQRKIVEQTQQLIDMGWKVPSFSDRNKTLRILEALSTGIHTGYCDHDGEYYIVDDKEIDPTTPMLVRVIT